MSTGLVWRESAFVELDFFPDGFGWVDPEDIGQLGFNGGCCAGILHDAGGLAGCQPLEAYQEFAGFPGEGHGQVHGAGPNKSWLKSTRQGSSAGTRIRNST